MACFSTKTLCGSKQGFILRRYAVFTNYVTSVDKGSDIHGTAAQHYPAAAALKLPDNYQDINASEVGQFSPLRSRELSDSVITSNISKSEEGRSFPKIDITVCCDPHVEPYDCRGAVNLSSSMQSNVPSPFGGQGGILGMPGSQWGQGYKYLSDYLHHSHYLNLRNTYSRALHSVCLTKGITRQNHTFSSSSLPLKNIPFLTHTVGLRTTGTDGSHSQKKDDEDICYRSSEAPTRGEQLKGAVAVYGSTVIVFHVAISLASLGAFYILVSSGLDVMFYMDKLGLADGALAKKVTANAGTFVLAYAIHKVFAPARIAITLTTTPFIVRHLRRIGFLKPPVKM